MDAVITQAFGNKYNRVQLIGSGSYSKVYRAFDQSDRLVAIKVVDVKHMQPEIIPYMENEIKLLKESDNKQVVQLYESSKFDNKLFLVMEFCCMDVADMANKHFNHVIPEELIINLMRQIIAGIAYLHKNQIIHRDLKLENFAVVLNEDDQQALKKPNTPKELIQIFKRATYKLIDLGLAKKFSSQQHTTGTWAGTELNMAPEIMEEKPYSYSADMYSLGVCLFQMATGRYPYLDPTNRTPQHELIKRGDAKFDLIKDQTLKDLVKRMLSYDPNQRLTFSDLYEHELFITLSGQMHTMLDGQLGFNKEIYKTLNKGEQQALDQPPFIQIVQKKEDTKTSIQVMQQAQKQEQNFFECKYIDHTFGNQRTDQWQGQFQQVSYTPNVEAQNNQGERKKLEVLFNKRNIYTLLFRSATKLEETRDLASVSKYNYTFLHTNFTMYTDYLRNVGKQQLKDLGNDIKKQQTIFENSGQFKFIQLEFKKDEKTYENIYSDSVEKGASEGWTSAIKKKVLKRISVERLGTLEFTNQYEQLNKEIYNELLLKLLQHITLNQGKEPVEQENRIKSNLYLSMLYLIMLRVLFQKEPPEFDAKQEELWLEGCRNEPDKLCERVTDMLEEHSIKY